MNNNDNRLEKMDAFFDRRLDGYEQHQLGIDCAKEFYPFTASCLPMRKHACVLDLGCGTGLELTYFFQCNPTAQVTGIDLAAGMLQKLQSKFEGYHVRTICGSYFTIPLGDAVYDAAVSVESLHHFEQQDKILLYKKLHAALKDGGYFVLTDYFAATPQEELFHKARLAELKIQQGITDNNFYHYDTPLTVAHEIEALRVGGFSSVEICGSWGATHTLKATK